MGVRIGEEIQKRSNGRITFSVFPGSQLGITVCTLALGGITKPAVHHWLTPVLEDVGLPAGIADGVAFLLAKRTGDAAALDRGRAVSFGG